MHTSLAKLAMKNVIQNKEIMSDNQFSIIKNAIKTFDFNLTFCGHPAIEAKLKLTEISKLDIAGFKECISFIPQAE